jgi:hypothetical protein
LRGAAEAAYSVLVVHCFERISKIFELRTPRSPAPTVVRIHIRSSLVFAQQAPSETRNWTD